MLSLFQELNNQPDERSALTEARKKTREALLNVNALAEYLDIPQATLYQWRARGEGPPGIRVGRYVRYRVSDVERWLDVQQHQIQRHRPRPSECR